MNLMKNKELIFDSLNLVNKCINTKDNNNNGELALDALKLFGKTLQASTEQTNKTMFYNDNNFFEKMKNSKYSKFINKIKALNIPINEYKLPIIVNIGNESSGKSSLIRNILKCDIFPIDRNLCTKCPIKIELFNSKNEEYIISFKNETFKLTDKEKTKLHISSIMNKIDDIVEDELYIKICNEYVINSTFYDLPGIIEYPAEMRDKSKNIINKYITQPNTLIICVIPANTTRLTSNQALGMVNDANKTKDCIIALTMVDLLHNDDIEIFIDRILLRNNEIKY
jgi:GTPase SAR1 family protein